MRNAGEGVEKRVTFWHCWCKYKLVQPLWKTVRRFLKKVKIELPYDPAIPLLVIYWDKTIIQKDICTPIVIAVLFTIVKTWKPPKCSSIDEQKKMWCIYTMEYYSATKRNKIMSFAATWMDLGHHTKQSQEEKDKYHIIDYN